MFWDCFSYNKKGPFHIWKAETAAQKKAIETDLKAQNILLEPEYKRLWELETVIQCIKLSRKPRGRKPV